MARLESACADGFAVLRGVLDKGLLSETLQRFSAQVESLSLSRDPLSADMVQNIERNEVPAHPTLAPFRLDVKNFRFLTESPDLREILKEIAGGEYLWHYPPMFRRMDPDIKAGILPYHQDQGYNLKYPKSYRCWVPFNDCGEDSPSLEIVKKKMDALLPHSPSGKWEHGLSEEAVKAASGGAETEKLTMKLGDVAIFDSLTLHRTHVTPGMKKTRFSMDAQFMAVADIPQSLLAARKYISAESATFVGGLV